MNKINIHNRKPINKRRYVQLLEQNLSDTGLMTAFTVPPITPEEEARARFLANDIAKKLDEAEGGRVRTLVAVRMYQMNVNGVVNWLKNPPLQHTDESSPLTAEAAEILEKLK
jgi:hypothetical protein